MRVKEIRREVEAARDQQIVPTRRGARHAWRSSIADLLELSRAQWIAAIAIGLVGALIVGALLVNYAMNRHPSGPITRGIVTPRPIQSSGLALALPNVSLPPFVCASQGMGSGRTTQPVAFIDLLSTATQTGYDRLVIEFSGGLPNGNIELRTQSGTKFTSSPSGRQVSLAGSNGIQILIQGADLHSSYRGPSDIVTHYPTLKEVRLVEDSDGVVRLGLGINGPPCYRAVLATNPDRLVIDVQSK